MGARWEPNLYLYAFVNQLVKLCVDRVGKKIEKGLHRKV